MALLVITNNGRSRTRSLQLLQRNPRLSFRHRLLCYLALIILCNFITTARASGSTASSVWLQEQGGGEDKQRTSTSKGRPLHSWLQQHWPNLFGHHHQQEEHTGTDHSNQGGRREKTQRSSSTTGAAASTDPTRRRRLYQHSWQTHIPQAWTSNNSTLIATALEKFSRIPSNTFPPFPSSMRHVALQHVRHMFTHAYDSYYYHAWPHGELLPVSCRGTNFSLIKLPALTAIDALDTFWVMGNTTELVRIVERLRQWQTTQQRSLWDVDENISLFETTIRVLGGLLSAHQILVDLEENIWQHDVWDPVTGQVLDGRSARPKDDVTNKCPAPLVCATEAWPGCLDANLPVDFSSSSCCSCEAKNTTRRPATAASYQYDGFLLDLAVEIANRMLPAFDTPTGIPYGTVNLQIGVPPGETPVASLAGAGTLVLEWELLSRLTGNLKYGASARLAARALWMRQSNARLVGKHIDSRNGQWVESLSGIGSNSDSYIEYLVKYGFLFLDGQGFDDDFRVLWPAIYQGIYQHLRRGDWYVDADYKTPTTGRPVFESLMAFYPGLQIWLGELGPAARSLNAFSLVREHLGFLPERFSYSHWRAEGPKYPLRPELFESNYFLHRTMEKFAVTSPFSNHSTHSGWLWAAYWGTEKLVKLQTHCGYASLGHVDGETTGAVGGAANTWKAEDDMPSFFLSETLKYLYLTFDENNVMHTDHNRQWMFTTEAHPIHLPPAESDAAFQNELLRLEEILVARTKASKVGKSNGRLSSDLWQDEQTTFKKFLSHLRSVELDMNSEQINLPHQAIFFRDRNLLEPTSPNDDHVDSWEEIVNMSNLAHFKFSAGGVGPGFSLRSACPNFYASDLLWIHALQGNSLDYIDGFISADDDHARKLISNNWFAYGSTEALAVVGLQYNPNQKLLTEGCPLRPESKKVKGNHKTKASDDTEDEVFEFESELGTFQITAFQDGSGFSVERSEDGQSLTTSFVHAFDDAHQGLAYLMLASGNKNDREAKFSSLSMADFSGNSFTCEISLLLIPKGTNPQENVGEEVLRVPCAPAMFGPAHMKNLIEHQGAEVYAHVQRAPVSDPMGCVESNVPPTGTWIPKNYPELLGDLEICPNVNIQIVHRGTCSFMTKATNMMQGHNADAVIVVNTVDDVFSMASDADVDALDPDQSPLTVLVSRGDAKKLFSTLNRHAEATTELVGKIELQPQPSLEELEEEGASSAVRLPMVHATESLIQIYATGNWGVQAVIANNNWNLQLVRHRLG